MENCMFTRHYQCSSHWPNIQLLLHSSFIAFLFFFHFSVTSVVLIQKSVSAPAIIYFVTYAASISMDVCYVSGSQIFLFHRISTEILAYRANPPSTEPDLSSLPKFIARNRGMLLIILVPLCSKKAISFSSLWYSPDHPFSHLGFLCRFIGTCAFIS